MIGQELELTNTEWQLISADEDYLLQTIQGTALVKATDTSAIAPTDKTASFKLELNAVLNHNLLSGNIWAIGTGLKKTKITYAK